MSGLRQLLTSTALVANMPSDSPAARSAAKWRAAGRRRHRLRVDLYSEAVGQPREVIEDPDDMGKFETALVIESHGSQRIPVCRPDRGGVEA